jgi:hypothetical protein
VLLLLCLLSVDAGEGRRAKVKWMKKKMEGEEDEEGKAGRRKTRFVKGRGNAGGK